MARRTRRLRYGPKRFQFGTLHDPDPGGAPECVVVLVHGGFWRAPYNRWLTSLLARDVARRGFVAFNIEYRRLGRFGGGGGWPETFDDVADATHAVADRFPGARVMLVGHSAGGHLALTAAARRCRSVEGVVSMAAPTDLRVLSAKGSETIDGLVASAPPGQRWSLTSPIEMLPIGVSVVCVHSDADTTVHPAMSIRFVEAALAAGDDAGLVLVEGERHRSALWPSSATWRSAIAAIEAWNENSHELSRNGTSVPMETA